MEDVKLSATAYAVLGLLSFGRPLSGYEIRQWARSALSHFYPAPAQSQIYGELGHLEASGLVAGDQVAQDDRPDKVVYTLTPEGLAILRRWADESPPAPSIKHHVALRVFFGHVGPPDALISTLENHRERLLVTLDELETQSVALSGESESGHAAAVADWVAEIHRGDLAGVERILKLMSGGTERPDLEGPGPGAEG